MLPRQLYLAVFSLFFPCSPKPADIPKH
uniref:Uncharacterized protein n=1 Tax=Anguilla anguilla TaxID=7936 RepID=A0A0E9R7Z7_ANGAN